jgi:hypothetical protein
LFIADDDAGGFTEGEEGCFRVDAVENKSGVVNRVRPLLMRMILLVVRSQFAFYHHSLRANLLSTEAGHGCRATPETRMMTTSVTRDQFEITENTITHKPTGTSFTRRPKDWLSGTLKQSRQDKKPPSGGEYDLQEVKRMIRQLAEEQSLLGE